MLIVRVVSDYYSQEARSNWSNPRSRRRDVPFDVDRSGASTHLYYNTPYLVASVFIRSTIAKINFETWWKYEQRYS